MTYTPPAQPGAAFTPTRSRCKGETMIEVLVTVIILAIGILGAASMQVTTLKDLSGSHNLSIAQIAAANLSESIRANPAGALANDYVHSSAPAGGYPDCTLIACSSSQLAAYDVGSWWNTLKRDLPSGSGRVTRQAGSNTFVLTVRWDDDRSGSGGRNCPTLSASDLECYQFSVTF